MPFRRRLLIIIATALVALLFAACSGGSDDDADRVRGSTSTTEADASPSGFDRAETESVALDVPDDWIEFEVGDLDDPDRLAEVRAVNPGLADAIEAGASVFERGGELLLVGPDSSNVNVIAIAGAAPPALTDAVIQEFEGQVAGAGGIVVDREQVSVDGREALRLSSRIPAPGPRGDTIELTAEQLVILDDRRLVVVSATVAPDGDPAVAEAILASVQVRER